MSSVRPMSALGQKQTLSEYQRDVRFAPESGHPSAPPRCQLWAITGLSGVFARYVLSCEGLGAGIEDDDEGALMGFAGSMRANCCPFQLGFAGAWVTPSGISTQGSFSAHQICRLGATQLGSSSVPALMNAIAPYAGPWL